MTVEVTMCDNTNPHDQHTEAGAWCPGVMAAPAPPKEKWVMTVHSGYGSTGEAMQPGAAVEFDNEQDAVKVAQGMNDMFRALREERVAVVTKMLPLSAYLNTAQALAEAQKMGKPIAPGNVAIDLRQIATDSGWGDQDEDEGEDWGEDDDDGTNYTAEPAGAVKCRHCGRAIRHDRGVWMMWRPELGKFFGPGCPARPGGLTGPFGARSFAPHEP